MEAEAPGPTTQAVLAAVSSEGNPSMSQRWLDVQHHEIRERNAQQRAEQLRQVEKRAQAAKAARR